MESCDRLHEAVGRMCALLRRNDGAAIDSHGYAEVRERLSADHSSRVIRRTETMETRMHDFRVLHVGLVSP